MSPARTHVHAPTLPRRGGGTHRRGARSGARSTGLRWDRIARVALIVVAIIVALLYVGPALGLFETMRESGQRNEQLRELEQQNRQLRERRDALNDPATLEREARRLGKVRPGERPYVIDGLPKD